MRKQNTELTASRVSQAWQYQEAVLVVLTNPYLHWVDTPLLQTLMVNESYLPPAVYEFPPSKSLLSAPPISYMAHVSFPKYFSIRMNWVSLFSLFTLT